MGKSGVEQQGEKRKGRGVREKNEMCCRGYLCVQPVGAAGGGLAVEGPGPLTLLSVALAVTSAAVQKVVLPDVKMEGEGGRKAMPKRWKKTDK